MGDTLGLNDLENELAELQKLLAQDESLTVGEETPTLGLYAFKEKLLLAEIDELENGLKNVTLCEEHGSLDSVKQNLGQITTQLDFTLSHEVSYHTQLLQEKAENSRVYKEQDEIKEALSQHISTLAADSTNRSIDSDRVLTNFVEKNKKATKLKRTLTRQMGQFISDTYPLPSQNDIEAFKKKRKKMHVCDISSCNDLTDLQGITELLMNKCLQEPNDPYLCIDGSFWPPYVELLLRMNIIQRHPSDAKRIKLTPYHI